jgi:hypothetical protein
LIVRTSTLARLLSMSIARASFIGRGGCPAAARITGFRAARSCRATSSTRVVLIGPAGCGTGFLRRVMVMRGRS